MSTLPAAKPIDLNRATIFDLNVDTEVDQLFTYAPWDRDQTDAGTQVRVALADAFKTIIRCVPPCPDRTVALRKLREARMDANSAITHRGRY